MEGGIIYKFQWPIINDQTISNYPSWTRAKHGPGLSSTVFCSGTGQFPNMFGYWEIGALLKIGHWKLKI